MNTRKQELIQEMLDMQAKFIAYEQSGEFNAEDYYVGEWQEYRERYTQLAAEVREIASQEANFWK
jgi:demethoxyubiquinone hydroxylase (CLK1/Coq7/Cat5 family)